jgi:hypothetical protein
MMATLASVNVGARLTARWAGRIGRTGIDKRPVTSRVPLSTLGIEHDEISHRRHHGLAFRSRTVEPELLPRLLDVPELAARTTQNAPKRMPA